MPGTFYQVTCEGSSGSFRCEYGAGAWFRMKGLLGRNGLDEGEAIWIRPCNSIHMFFMKFAIDAVFLDKENRIVRLYEPIRPWAATPIIWAAHSVVEMRAGDASRYGLQKGKRLSFSSP